MSSIPNRDFVRCYACNYTEIIPLWNAHPFGCPECGSSALSVQNYLTKAEATELMNEERILL